MSLIVVGNGEVDKFGLNRLRAVFYCHHHEQTHRNGSF
nr:MAG TPA_asm: hypothetical protein [Caudoviricetes sp.]